ncbi:MAG: hypothetical protein HeimC3_34690 [Candidatus Heimdallarchaeota archaeon LC_3]|nr:MAG: hypothetical protein HeimC3_34690 [Candidatus Heimdallarchaeota archaeon LC_3]
MILADSLGSIYGLASALSWGAGDFSGGVATKKTNVYSVVIGSQLIGILFLIILAFIFLEQIPLPTDIIWGMIAGLIGAFGLVVLYQGLSIGKMTVVAPTSAIFAVIIPLIASSINEGIPNNFQILGFVVAILSVWLVTQTSQDVIANQSGFKYGVLAGLGFGLFFITINQVQKGFVFWPLVAARFASIFILFVISLVMRKIQVPKSNQLPIIISAGIFDVGGNAFFVLAAHSGRLDIASVLSSFYPAVTVILALIIMKEKLSRLQIFGILFVIIAILLITAG